MAEFQAGKLFPRLRFIVPNPGISIRAAIRLYNEIAAEPC
jgi:hypothetical protein